MYKNLKMALQVTISVTIIISLCLTSFYLVITSRIKTFSESNIINNMYTALDGQANMIKLFVSESERSLMEYAAAAELHELLLDPENPGKIQAAQDYTLRYFKNLDSWEGIYLSNWDTKVLVHSTPQAVGMVTRSGDSLIPYQETMIQSPNGFYNGGAFISPASGKLIFNYRMMLRDDNGTPIGLVGGGPFISGLNDLLGKMSISGMEEEEYAILDAKNSIYTYNTDNNLIMTPVQDQDMLDIISTVQSGRNRACIYKKDCIIVYQFIPDLDLILTMRDTSKEILESRDAIARTIVILTLITIAVIIIAVFATSNLIAKPLSAVEKAVNRLSALSLRQNDDIQNLIGSRNEVGIIASSVNRLTDTLRGIVSMLRGCSDTLKNGTDVITKTVDSLLINIGENSKTTDKLSESLNDTSKTIQKVNNDISSINNIIEESKKSNAERIIIADNTIKDAELLAASITDKARVTETNISSAMEKLHNLDSINEKIKRIQEISSQTKVLAINASIEASEAGRAGRGFAMVAKEIKNLSVSSAETAKEIDNACQNMGEIISSIDLCFKDIIDFIRTDIRNGFGDINDAFGQMKDSMDVVNDEMESIFILTNSIQTQSKHFDEIIQTNENNIRNIEENEDMTNSIITRLGSFAKTNSTTVNEINNMISKFK